MKKFLLCFVCLTIFFACCGFFWGKKPKVYPIDNNSFSMELYVGVWPWLSDTIYITNVKGVDIRNVNGVLHLTGARADKKKVTFYRSSIKVGEKIKVKFKKSESVKNIQKIRLEINSDEGKWEADWNFL